MASEALSAGASIMGGRAQSKALMTEAALLERQAKDVDLQALQVSERRREDLRAAMSTVENMRAARGLNLDSPSAIAIEKELRRQARRDEGAERLGFVNQASALRLSSQARRKGARSAMMIGYLQGASTLIGGAQNKMAATSTGAKGGG